MAPGWAAAFRLGPHNSAWCRIFFSKTEKGMKKLGGELWFVIEDAHMLAVPLFGG